MSTCQSSSCSSSCNSQTVDEAPSAIASVESTFSVPGMDCPSEENLIRMALGGLTGVGPMTFDLAHRQLRVVHSGEPARIAQKLTPLNLGAVLLTSERRTEGGQWKTRFSVPKMDCPSEENLIRMALADASAVAALDFDLKDRVLTVQHWGSTQELLGRLIPLNLGAQVLDSVQSDESTAPDAEGNASEARTLKLLLAINGAMFVFELIVGLIAQSTGLIADSLDMFADAAVYGLALYAVGRAAALKMKAAHIAGWLQVVLALGALLEVVRRAVVGSEPASMLMMSIGLVALIANVTCLVLIAKKRDRGAHMTASYIFSANDVIANAGVIVAGVLVAWTGSSYPDLVIGAVIALIVLSGARRILNLR